MLQTVTDRLSKLRVNIFQLKVLPEVDLEDLKIMI